MSPVRDDGFAGAQPRGNNRGGFRRALDLYPALLRAVLLRHHPDPGAFFVMHHCVRKNAERAAPGVPLKLDGDGAPRNKRLIGIRDLGINIERIGVRSRAVVGERNARGLRELRSVS